MFIPLTTVLVVPIHRLPLFCLHPLSASGVFGIGERQVGTCDLPLHCASTPTPTAGDKLWLCRCPLMPRLLKVSLRLNIPNASPSCSSASPSIQSLRESCGRWRPLGPEARLSLQCPQSRKNKTRVRAECVPARCERRGEIIRAVCGVDSPLTHWALYQPAAFSVVAGRQNLAACHSQFWCNENK